MLVLWLQKAEKESFLIQFFFAFISVSSRKRKTKRSQTEVEIFGIRLRVSQLQIYCDESDESFPFSFPWKCFAYKHSETEISLK